MKTLSSVLAAALALATTLPAIANPSEPTTERTLATQPDSRVAQHCTPPAALVLPLDHGPHAQTTPYLNRLRKARHDALLQACKRT